MEHLRMSGAYWGLTALDIMGRLGDMNADEIVAWILKCQDECGGFGGNYQHDPHILYTLSAVQILCLFDRLDAVDGDKIARRLMRCWYDRLHGQEFSLHQLGSQLICLSRVIGSHTRGSDSVEAISN